MKNRIVSLMLGLLMILASCSPVDNNGADNTEETESSETKITIS